MTRFGIVTGLAALAALAVISSAHAHPPPWAGPGHGWHPGPPPSAGYVVVGPPVIYEPSPPPVV
ncbi:MAG TPA: hypothetical protein VMU82_00480 [Acetobacteraceae bacterium]|nr:hypothetical protein [Acetobacteraceae bacterium]